MLRLPPEVIEICSAGCPDLRLFGPDGRETPFTVIEDMPSSGPQEKYQMEITQYIDGPEAVIFMRLPERYRPISVVEIHTPDRDFKKRVVLSSSRDGKIWRTIAEDAIYDFSSRIDLRKTKIEFKKTDDRYFRLKLLDYGKAAARDPKLRLRYQGLDFSVESMTPKELAVHRIYGLTAVYREGIPLYDSRTITDLHLKTDRDGNTVMLIAAGLPLDRISFDIADLYYSRATVVYAGDDRSDDSFRFLVRGTVYSFSLDGREEKQDIVEVRSRKSGYYKIVIENRGNPPLDIRSVALSWTRRNLYFIPIVQGGYTLCFGYDDMPMPEYDITRFINRESLSSLSPVRLSLEAIRNNPDFAPKRLGHDRERTEKIVLVSIVVILVGVMGYWAYSLIRKAGRNEP